MGRVRCCGACGAIEPLLTGCRAGSIVLLVPREKEARGIAESIGRHQLRLSLVGVAIVIWSPALCSLTVLCWRSTGGIMGGRPTARCRTRSGLRGRSFGKCWGGGSVGDRGGRWSISRFSKRRRSCFIGRLQIFV